MVKSQITGSSPHDLSAFHLFVDIRLMFQQLDDFLYLMHITADHMATVDGWAQVYERPGRSQKFGSGFVGGQPPVV